VAELQEMLVDEIQSHILQDICRFWQDHTSPISLMSAADIELRRLEHCLPYMIVFDIEGDPWRFRYRYVGTCIDGTNGQFRTGRYLDEMDLGEINDRTHAKLSLACHNKEPSHTRGQFTEQNGKVMHFERLALPLASNRETVDSMLVGVHYLRMIHSSGIVKFEDPPAYLSSGPD
jgi:hypothetical protein